MKKNRTLVILATAWALGGVDSCGEDLIADSGFDLWCGDELCGWEIESGDVAAVPTWHSEDLGASMVGDPVAISQATEHTEADAQCILFSLLADVGEGASLTLELDFGDDGVAEYSHPLPADDWAPAGYFITPPVAFDGIRFRLRKSGSGEAVIAQLRAQVEDPANCTEPPLDTDGDG